MGSPSSGARHQPVAGARIGAAEGVAWLESGVGDATSTIIDSQAMKATPRMSPQTTTQHHSAYSRTARVLHWSMALLILSTIPVGFLMVQEGLARSLQNALFIYHKNVGVLLLVLIAVRIAYRFAVPPPRLPDQMPAWQAKAAGLSHIALYALMLIMPVAGYIRVKAGGFPIETLDALGIGSPVPRSDEIAEIAKTVHYYGALALTAVVALHILAAAHHGLIRRDGIFSRMWSPKDSAGG